jgi:hypothetical protein
MAPDTARDLRIETLISSYPRVRVPLTPAHEAVYVREYRFNRKGEQGLPRIVRSLEAWMHRAITSESASNSVLEIGAGTLNHLPYEHSASTYEIVEPFRALWEDSPYRGRVTGYYDDISEIPEDRMYDRVLSVAVLEHLTELPYMLARSAMLLRPGGHFQAGFPSVGEFLWEAAWRLTTGVAYRLRTGLSYAVLMRNEHVNRAAEIIAVAQYLFEDVAVRRFPTRLRSLSFYTAINACRPRLTRCAAIVGAQNKLVAS